MQMQIDKKWLIALVNEVKNEINPEEAIQDEENKNDRNKNGVGTNQFRSLAALCSNAENYDEIKLLVQYKTAKIKKIESWKIEKNGKRFGDVIIEKSEKIKKEYKEDTVVLEAIRLFFGYLNQSARVWRNEILQIMAGKIRRKITIRMIQEKITKIIIDNPKERRNFVNVI